MLDNFDPKEKKAIILFFAFLLLAVAYLYTHEVPWDTPERSPLPDGQQYRDRLGEPPTFDTERSDPPPSRKEHSYERYL